MEWADFWWPRFFVHFRPCKSLGRALIPDLTSLPTQLECVERASQITVLEPVCCLAHVVSPLPESWPQKSYETKQYKKGLKASDQILKKFPEHGGITYIQLRFSWTFSSVVMPPY